jgi:hypothetical protein
LGFDFDGTSCRLLGVLVSNILSEEVGIESRVGFSSNPKFRVLLRKKVREPLFIIFWV